jgi:hypothetical protein
MTLVDPVCQCILQLNGQDKRRNVSFGADTLISMVTANPPKKSQHPMDPQSLISHVLTW